jgi:hypothetical protein
MIVTPAGEVFDQRLGHQRGARGNGRFEFAQQINIGEQPATIALAGENEARVDMADAGAAQVDPRLAQHPDLRGQIAAVIVLDRTRALDLGRRPAAPFALLEHIDPHQHTIMLEGRLEDRPRMASGDKRCRRRQRCRKVRRIDHQAAGMKRAGNRADIIAGGKAGLGACVLLGEFGTMGRQPQPLGTLLEGGDLRFGQAEPARAGLPHAAIPKGPSRQKWSFNPRSPDRAAWPSPRPDCPSSGR